MKKRLLVVALSLCLVVAGVSGCGKKEKDNSSAPPADSSTVSTVKTPAPTPQQTAKAVLVKADGGLNIRSKPSTDGEILHTAENGSKLPLLIETPTGGWYQVEYDGKTAYVSAEYASPIDVTLEEYNRLRAGSTATSSASSQGGSDDPQAGKDDPQGTTSSAPISTSATPTPSPSSGGDEDGE